jgi:hypothetical protein
MRMSEWVARLDQFLQFNEYEILKDAGRIKKSVADAFAEKQYEKFRIIQDKEYKSDFDKIIEDIKNKGELPKEDANKKVDYIQPNYADLTLPDEVVQRRFGDTIKKISKAGKPPKEDKE